MELTVEKANEMLSGYLDLYYSLSLEDVEITDTKGYWRIKELCDESCHHPIHMCLGCEGKMHHTISYTQHDRNDKGQFRSPYRVWKVLHEEKTMSDLNG